ncbi:HNH endonuclease [Bacillus phage BSTP3]|nr:HNH endonuclease [Bacillus phage BSTP3]
MTSASSTDMLFFGAKENGVSDCTLGFPIFIRGLDYILTCIVTTSSQHFQTRVFTLNVLYSVLTGVLPTAATLSIVVTLTYSHICLF